MNRKKAARGAAVFMSLLAAAEAGSSVYFYRRTMIRNNAKMERTMKMAGTDWTQHMPFIQERKEYMMSQPHEDVWVHSDDGLKLHATWFPQADQKKIVICFHGSSCAGTDIRANVPYLPAAHPSRQRAG